MGKRYPQMGKGGDLRKVPGLSPVPLREPRRGFSPKARGYAVVGVTPGMVGKCVTTPKVVVTNGRTEGMLGLYIV